MRSSHNGTPSSRRGLQDKAHPLNVLAPRENALTVADLEPPKNLLQIIKEKNPPKAQELAASAQWTGSHCPTCKCAAGRGDSLHTVPQQYSSYCSPILRNNPPSQMFRLRLNTRFRNLS